MGCRGAKGGRGLLKEVKEDENMGERKRREKKRIMGRQLSMRLDQLIQTCFTLSLIHFYDNLLVTAHFYKFSYRAKVVDAANEKEEPTDKNPASFKSDVWKRFGFSVSTNKKGEKAAHRQQTVCRHLYALVALFVYFLTFEVQSRFNKF